MADQVGRHQLGRLYDLLLKERECAKALDIEGMTSVAKEKTALLKVLASMEDPDQEDLALARAIRAENRRNAYLFWSTLKWVRETMEFFGKQVSTKVYDAAGNAISSGCNGRLLSGKV